MIKLLKKVVDTQPSGSPIQVWCQTCRKPALGAKTGYFYGKYLQPGREISIKNVKLTWLVKNDTDKM